jgi:hypothetical protein
LTKKVDNQDILVYIISIVTNKEERITMLDVIMNVATFGTLIVVALVVMSKINNSIETAQATAEREARLLARK